MAAGSGRPWAPAQLPQLPGRSSALAASQTRHQLIHSGQHEKCADQRVGLGGKETRGEEDWGGGEVTRYVRLWLVAEGLKTLE